jgi:hypothetical protein
MSPALRATALRCLTWSGLVQFTAFGLLCLTVLIWACVLQ